MLERLIHARNLWFGVSGILTVLAIAALATWGLRIGIDFEGGQLLEAQFRNQTSIEQVRTALTGEALPSSSVAESGTNAYLIRTHATEEQLASIRSNLSEQVGEWSETRFENVGPTVGRDLTQRAILAVALASVMIILYIAWAFRRVPPPTNSWQFGITAVIALLHDLLVTIGIFAVLGHFLGYEVDSLFITALLTVMGFSVHDTIVVYDRVRENLMANTEQPFRQIVHHSINQTLVRSLNTSLTLMIVLLTLLVLGGSSIRPFVSALLAGVLIGTYSSVFLASNILITWQSFVAKRRARAATSV